MISLRVLASATFFLVVANPRSFGNGGAWQTGVPLTGNGAASDQKKATNVTIEDEKLTIDLHQEFAAVEVRYRMKNTGGQVDQDFFFPVEQWAPSDGEDAGTAKVDLEGYTIAADGQELQVNTVNAKGEKPKVEKDASGWGDFKPGKRLWKKSVIPFAPGQTREVVIRYRSPYAANQSSVSDDSHSTEMYFRYALSPAATWKGPIGKGKVTVNCLHPLPEEVTITKPKDRFRKINATRFEWEFQNLKPTLADDIKIVAHAAYDHYYAYTDRSAEDAEQPPQPSGVYVVQNKRYFLQHTDYTAVASSTLKPQGENKYDVDKIATYDFGTWAEGVEGDGIGESITLTVKRPLPLDAILIVPGYKSDDESLWTKNNRVAELEVTLNGEHTFVAAIPDEKFVEDYPIPVRGYTKPVNNVKLVIKAVHRGTSARDTCISAVRLRAKLDKKPAIKGAR